MRELAAWIGERRVGRFSEDHRDEGSAFLFEYESDADENDAVSLTMVPGDERRFEMRSFPAPFDMILPEGGRRRRIEDARKILPADPFSLLSYVGGNPVNRVRFLPLGETPGKAVPALPPPKEIAACENGLALFARLVADLDLRQGIAGVQPKLLGGAGKPSAAMRNFRGSTHILKASTEQYPCLAANEYACMQVFRAAGLAVPEAVLSADGELLLVSRFDILADATMLGFEEAAALMGETAATKYLRDYGTLVDVMASFVQPSVEASVRERLVTAIVLNWMIGNGDAHLKNFGVLYAGPASVDLAPFYDSVCTRAYLPDDVPALALSFDHYSKAWWPRAKLEEFAMKHGALSPKAVATMFERCKAAVADGLGQLNALARRIPAFAPVADGMRRVWTG